MVSLAQIRPGDTVLEPSAGTGALLDAIRHEAADSGDLTAVEINEGLTAIVKKVRRVHYGDFLECNGELGKFDCIVMNPPFITASDSKHITHVTAMLKPEGRIVTLCANGPRQDNVLKPLVKARERIWEELPADTFKSQGTVVRCVLLAFTAPR